MPYIVNPAFLTSAYATDWGILLLRLAVGALFIVHALPKLKNPAPMAQGLGWPTTVILLQGLVELLAGAALILGYWIRYASLILMIIMLGALYYKLFKWRIPFVGKEQTGWELDLILFFASLLFFLSNGGGLGIGI